MYVPDPECEELSVFEGAGVSVEYFNLVVHPLQRSGRDLLVVLIEKALAVFVQGGGEALLDSDARRFLPVRKYLLQLLNLRLDRVVPLPVESLPLEIYALHLGV